MTDLKMKEFLQKRIDEVTEQIELMTEPDWVAWGLITRAALYKESGNEEAAIRDLSAAIELPDISMDKLEEALRARSWIRHCNNQYAAALMDIEQIMHEPEMPRDRVMGARLQFNEIVRAAGVAGIDLVNVGCEPRNTQ
jgi:hypothetical protein